VKSLWTLGGSAWSRPDTNLDKLTQTSVLCYRLTLRKPLLLRKHCLDNMFVTEEASFVFRSLLIHE
jgi:hypothetical protein